ncbi:MAG: exodeoxyribonuclease VII small subunit [Prevotella sp.]|nr:exodeoxyribonuclease VII small subunit [Prevotella sp.]
MKKEIKYEEAIRQLEDIVRQMESGQLDIDSLSKQLATAQQLIKLCKTKLTKTDNEISKLLEKNEKQ